MESIKWFLLILCLSTIEISSEDLQIFTLLKLQLQNYKTTKLKFWWTRSFKNTIKLHHCSFCRIGKKIRYRGFSDAVEKQENFSRSSTIHLGMNEINEKCDVLQLDVFKTEMVLGLRDLQKHNCVIGLRTNQLWTTPIMSAIASLSSLKW